MNRTAMICLALLLLGAAGWFAWQWPKGTPGEREGDAHRSTAPEVAVPTKSDRAANRPVSHVPVSDELAAIIARLERVAEAALEEAARQDPAASGEGLREKIVESLGSRAILESLSADQLKALVHYVDIPKADSDSLVPILREAFYRQWAKIDPKGAHQMALSLPLGEYINDSDPLATAYQAVYDGWAEQDAAAAWQQRLQDIQNSSGDGDNMLLALIYTGPLVMRYYARQNPGRAWEAMRTSGPSNDLIEAFFEGAPSGEDWPAYAAELESWKAEGIKKIDALPLAGRWAESDSQAAMAWAVESDDGNFGGTDYVQGQVLHRWHGVEPKQAARWIEREAAAERMEVVESFAMELIDSAGTAETAQAVIPILRDNEQRAQFVFWLAEWGPRITTVGRGTNLSQEEMQKIVDGSGLAERELIALRDVIKKRAGAAE